MIARSEFLRLEGSEDHFIICVKEGLCTSDSSILQEQLLLPKSANALNANPFEPTNLEVKDANIEDNLIYGCAAEYDFVPWYHPHS